MTLFSSQPGDEGLPGPARARVMAAIMTTTLMGVFDGTMINIALPSMAQEMQVPASIAVWFANGYLLAAAMSLAIFAALAARLGYRPVFLAGLTTFTLTSLGCALAKTPEVLIGMRVLQGVRRRGDAEYCPRNPAIRISRAITWPHSGVTRSAHRLQLRYRAGIGWDDPSHPELAMAVCDKRGSRHPRLTAGGQSAAAGCGSKASALRHPGRHIVGAAAGVDDHGGEQPPGGYLSPRQSLLDGARCAERHGVYLADPPHG